MTETQGHYIAHNNDEEEWNVEIRYLLNSNKS